MRFTPFTGPKNPIKHGKNAKVAKSTRVCPPTGYFRWLGLKGISALNIVLMMRLIPECGLPCPESGVNSRICGFNALKVL